MQQQVKRVNGNSGWGFRCRRRSPKCMQRKIVKCALNLHVGVDATPQPPATIVGTPNCFISPLKCTDENVKHFIGSGPPAAPLRSEVGVAGLPPIVAAVCHVSISVFHVRSTNRATSVCPKGCGSPDSCLWNGMVWATRMGSEQTVAECIHTIPGKSFAIYRSRGTRDFLKPCRNLSGLCGIIGRHTINLREMRTYGTKRKKW